MFRGETSSSTSNTFLFSAHVAAPYQFPHLYPHAQDWLEFVEPKHVKVFVEIWDDGDVQQFEIESIRKHVSKMWRAEACVMNSQIMNSIP